MKKQTAVEWLVQWAKENPVVYQKDYDAAIEWAKAMEKEQIDESFKEGYKNGVLKEKWEQTYGGDK